MTDVGVGGPEVSCVFVWDISARSTGCLGELAAWRVLAFVSAANLALRVRFLESSCCVRDVEEPASEFETTAEETASLTILRRFERRSGVGEAPVEVVAIGGCAEGGTTVEREKSSAARFSLLGITVTEDRSKVAKLRNSDLPLLPFPSLLHLV